MKSYRRERMAQLRADIRRKHAIAGRVALPIIRERIPVGTPETTGHKYYVVTAKLQNSITPRSGDDYVQWGTNVPYAPYVHNGTYDYNRPPLGHGRGEWTEAEAREFDDIRYTGEAPRPPGPKGMRPRAFLVNGLLNALPALSPVYRKPINI